MRVPRNSRTAEPLPPRRTVCPAVEVFRSEEVERSASGDCLQREDQELGEDGKLTLRSQDGDGVLAPAHPTVLLVDDNRDLLLFLKRLMADAGWTLLTAESAELPKTGRQCIGILLSVLERVRLRFATVRLLKLAS